MNPQLKKIIDALSFLENPVLIKQDGTVTEIFPKDGKHFSLKECQKFVEGYIEHVYLRETTKRTNFRVLVVNEEAKLSNRFSINKIATDYYQHYTGIDDVILGDVLLTPKKFLQ